MCVCSCVSVGSDVLMHVRWFRISVSRYFVLYGHPASVCVFSSFTSSPFSVAPFFVAAAGFSLSTFAALFFVAAASFSLSLHRLVLLCHCCFSFSTFTALFSSACSASGGASSPLLLEDAVDAVGLPPLGGGEPTPDRRSSPADGIAIASRTGVDRIY